MEQKPSLCRICLKVGATQPIFEGHEKNCILNKLTMCLNEKLEDLDGYPRNICDECKENLDTLCNFIKKFRSTNIVLQNGLRIKKAEKNTEQLGGEDSENIEVKLENIKYELEIDRNSDFSENDFNPEPLPLINRKKSIIAKCISKRNSKTKKKNNTTGKTARSSCLKKNNNTDGAVGKKTKSTQKVFITKLPKEKAPPCPKLCHICGEVFQTSEELSAHKKTKHNKEATCPHCQKKIVSNYYLMKHIKRIHGGPKDFICAVCSRAFAFQKELTNHMRQVHNKKVVVEKKTFSCKFCNKIYHCEKSVIIHERSAHTGERPAVCSVCGNSFFHEEYLRQHMRLHTGETPFKCPVCRRGYAQQSNMKSHLRIHKISELDKDTLNKMRPSYLKLLKQ